MVEIERLDEVAARRGVVQDRPDPLTVGVEAHTHEFIATAHEDQKFGFSLSGGKAMAAVARVFETATCVWSGCTATSARRSSRSTGSSWPRTASSG